MNAVGGGSANSSNLSESDDTQLLQRLLESNEMILDCGRAGTVFRFLLAFKAYKNEACILTGDERMKQRPVAALVDALRDLGAYIEYIGEPGFPPVRILPSGGLIGREVKVDATVSSQFLSALAMIAPYLPKGLTIHPDGNPVSGAYFNMTLSMMERCGIAVSREANAVAIHPGKYNFDTLAVESDWSSASYFYAFCALLPGSEIELRGLFPHSLQGDAVIAGWMEKFGVSTRYTDRGVIIKSQNTRQVDVVEFDFIDNPDLFQTIAFMCAVMGCQALYTGLDTLKDKETDRVLAVQHVLGKVGVHLMKLPPKLSGKSKKTYYLQEGKAQFDKVLTETYGDHRMAMSAALLCVAGDVTIENHSVISKSYPEYFNDLFTLIQS